MNHRLIETPDVRQLRLMLCIVLKACGGEVVVSNVDPASVLNARAELVETVEKGKKVVRLVLRDT